MNRKQIRLYLRLAPILILLVAGVWFLQRPARLTPESVTSREAQAERLGLDGVERERYVAEMGEDPESEGQFLLSAGDFWAHRFTYPTGEFSQEWLTAAAEEDRQVPRGIPAGQSAFDPSNTESPLGLDPTRFTALGPEPLQSNGCQGCYSYGHVAGRTNVVVSDPVSTNIAYLGSDGGGVWKTENCCDTNTTWTPVTDDPLLSTIAIGDMILDPNDHNTIYAGTGDLRYGSFSFGAAGLLKSTNAGATWTVLGLDIFGGPYPPDGVFPQYQAIGKVQVDPNDSNKVIVGTKTGLFFSYDGGTNWDGPCYTNSYLNQRQDITGLLVRDDGSSTSLYAAVGTRGFATPVQPDLSNTGANGVYSTVIPASGCPASWNLLNNGWPAGTGDGNPANDLVGRIDIALAPSNDQVIYAQVANNTNSGATLGVWRTTDGGATWTQRATPADFNGCGVGQTWYNAGLTVDPNNSDNVFLSMIDLYRSTNGGDTFNDLTLGYCGGNTVHVDHHARAYVGGSSDVLLAGSDGGVYVTHNATAANPTFTQMNDTLPTIEFYSGDITADFANSPTPGINAGAQDNGSAVYVWNGNPGPAMWQMRNGGDGMFARIEPILGQRWYQESQNGNLRVSTTGPYGGLVNITGGWSGDTRKSFIFPYEIYKYDCPATGCEHLIAGSYRVWESVSGGIPSSSWLVNSPDLTKNTLADRSHINQLAYSVTDSSIAIVGTNDGNVQYGFGLGQGTANSATWVDVTGSNAVLPNRPILDVATDPVNPLIGYAAVGGFSQNTPGTPGHVYQVTCTANCASFTWLDKSGNLPNVPIDSIIANPNYPQQVFAGSDWGLYFTDDITVVSPVWNKFTAGVPNVMIWDMAIDHGFTTLALFTRSRGAYVWPLPSGPINVDYGVYLGPNGSQDALPGTNVIHTFVVGNVGMQDDSYDLSIGGNSWPTTLLTSSPIAVQSGMTATVSVEVAVPHDPFTDDGFTLTATSVNSPTVSASAVGTTYAIVHPAVQASADDDSLSGSTGDVLTYTLTVTNTGDYTDTYTVNLSGNSWLTTVSTSIVGPLGPGQNATVEVYVTIGDDPSDTVTVAFISTLDINVSDSVDLTSSLIGDDYLIYIPMVLRP